MPGRTVKRVLGHLTGAVGILSPPPPLQHLWWILTSWISSGRSRKVVVMDTEDVWYKPHTRMGDLTNTSHQASSSASPSAFFTGQKILRRGILYGNTEDGDLPLALFCHLTLLLDIIFSLKGVHQVTVLVANMNWRNAWISILNFPTNRNFLTYLEFWLIAQQNVINGCFHC